MSTIRAVVFDLDGVIIDSEEVWEEVRRGYVAEYGREFLPDSQDRMMGMSTGEWSHYLSDDLGVDRSAEQVAAEVVDEMARRYAERVPLIDGADDVVRRLAVHWPPYLNSGADLSWSFVAFMVAFQTLFWASYETMTASGLTAT